MKVKVFTIMSLLFSIVAANLISKPKNTKYREMIQTYCENNGCDNYYELSHNHLMEAVTSSPLNSSPLTTPLIDQKFDSVNVKSFWMFFDKKYLRHSMGWTVTLIVAYMLIFIAGITGNLMVILVVVKRRQMRSVTNMFIMNLAVADLFVILFCVPATLLSNILTPWILGSVMCKSVTYVQGVSVCASAYSLAAISIDRCRAIYRALGRPRGLSKRQTLSVICLIWSIALLITIPWAVTFDVVFFKDDGMSYCVETWENAIYGKIYYIVVNLFCCYCLPLILISVSNVIIWCHVKKRKVPQDSASAASIKKIHRKTRHGVRRMLGIVNFAFLLSWLPLYILVTKMKFTNQFSNSDLSVVLLPLAQLLGSWNSSMKSILYAFLNKKFREMFKSLLPRCCCVVFEKRSNITVRYSNENLAMSNGYGTGGSRAMHCSIGTPHNQKRKFKCSLVRGGNDGLNCNKGSRVGQSVISKTVLGTTQKTLVIVVTSPTSSSASVLNDKERISLYVSSSISMSSLEHM